MSRLTKSIAALLALTVLLSGCGKAEGTKETSVKGVGSTAQFEEPKKGDTVAAIEVKDFGTIRVKFFADKAPKAVENFLTHAKKGYYDGLTFHRILNEFMIQGGDPTGNGSGGESIWGKSFEDEFDESLQPVRGALCMANAGPNTNGSQFFIVQAHPYEQEYVEAILEANKIEKGKTFHDSYKIFMEAAYGTTYSDELVDLYMENGGTPWLYGAHTVFGQIYEEQSYDVLDSIAATKLKDEQNGIPEQPVVIEKITISKYK